MSTHTSHNLKTRTLSMVLLLVMLVTMIPSILLDGLTVYAAGIGQDDQLAQYIGYGYEGEERDGLDFEISSAGAFAFLDEHFVLTDAQKASMKEDSRYNAATDKFSLTWPGSNLNREICGYTHNGGNNYTVYYAASNSGGEECNVYWKVVLEHNAPNGKPNRYISIVRVDSIPSNITK